MDCLNRGRQLTHRMACCECSRACRLPSCRVAAAAASPSLCCCSWTSACCQVQTCGNSSTLCDQMYHHKVLQYTVMGLQEQVQASYCMTHTAMLVAPLGVSIPPAAQLQAPSAAADSAAAASAAPAAGARSHVPCAGTLPRTLRASKQFEGMLYLLTYTGKLGYRIVHVLCCVRT